MVVDFPIEKTIVLNAIYDMTEQMDFQILQTDRKRGYIRFRERDGGFAGRIAVSSIPSEAGTYTRIGLENIEAPELAAVILDEIKANMHWCFEEK